MVGRAVEPPMSCSSADEMKEVETKIRKKKGKNKVIFFYDDDSVIDIDF